MQKFNIKLEDERCKPEIGSEHSAGLDLKVFLGTNPRKDAIVIPAGEIVVLETGVSMAIPEGWVGLIAPRSSMGKRKLMLANTIGVIDSDYRGKIKILFHNYGTEDQILYNFDRICQIVVTPFFPGHLAEYVDNLDETIRGEGGFGSTGI